MMIILCITALYSKEESVGSTVNMDLVIGSCVAAVVCIVIFAVVIFFWLKSRKLKTKQKCEEPVVVYRDANVTIVGFRLFIPRKLLFQTGISI